MKKKETYRRLIGCPNCSDNQELFIPKGLVWKEYVIPPEALCTNCGCRLDGKDTPKPVEHNCDNCEHQPNAVLYCQFQPTECRYYTPKPPEPAETAFQGTVRVFLTGQVGLLKTRSWDYIKTTYPRYVSLVRDTFNATLDLAMAAIDYKVAPLGSGGSLDKIHALKEPTP